MFRALVTLGSLLLVIIAIYNLFLPVEEGNLDMIIAGVPGAAFLAWSLLTGRLRITG